MRVWLLAAVAAVSVAAACANSGSESRQAPAGQDRVLQERAAQVTAPLGRPPESTPNDVATEALADPAPPPEAGDPDDIRVPGQNEPTPLPPGDPRTGDQRMADIRAWDRCVMRAQAQMTDGQPGRLQESPEELCRRALGMRDRTSPSVRD